uniref:ABC transmembrane type-1 domain-containing protein n=1 Tax=Megaselia scalaris TaxID=36166 RepID=T1GI51_MEGSC
MPVDLICLSIHHVKSTFEDGYDMWIKDIFKIGLSRPIAEEDFFELKPSFETTPLSENLNNLWQDEKLVPKPSVLRILWKASGLKIILLGVAVAVIQTITRAIIFSFPGRIFCCESNRDLRNSSLWLCVWYRALGFLPAICFHNLNYNFLKIGTKIRLGLSGLIYNKCLKSSKSSSNDGLSARAINIMSSDLEEYDVAIANIHDLWMRPLEVCIYGYIMSQEVGFAATSIGLLFLLMFIPLQAWCGKMTTHYYATTSDITDWRVKIMNEIFQGIQVIKMYVWEKSFAKLIAKIRIKEMAGFKAVSNIMTMLAGTHFVSTISVFLSIMTYIYFGGTLSARKVFFISSFFNILNEGMIEDWPQSIIFCTHLYVSSKRVTEFLLEGEFSSKEETNSKRKVNENTKEKRLIFNNVSARWGTNTETTTPHLKNIDLTITDGCMVGVIGQVGSGKTTLLNCILGEVPIVEGSVIVDGKITSQEPWIIEGSIKDNIVFVDEYDSVRYAEVVKACSLLKDLKIFPNGDETLIGERGVTLSGGQKARINLARAVYRQADIYLLDDPLSAVDTEVGRHIFDQCITKLLKGKITVLVTHQHQYLKNVEQILVLNSGIIENQGSYQSIQKTSSFLKRLDSVDDLDDLKDNQKPELQNQKSVSLNELEQHESQEKVKNLKKGIVSWDCYSFYFGALRNPIFVASVFFLIVLNKLTMTSVDYYLVNWEQEMAANDTSPATESTSIRLQLIVNYGLILMVALIVFLAKTLGFFSMCLKIAYNMHDMFFNRISRASMYFFNTNNSGNLQIVSLEMSMLWIFLVDFVGLLAIVSMANPYLLIPATFIMFVLYGMRTLYTKGSQDMKRIESASRSPIFSMTNETFQGLTTIRAFGAEKSLRKIFHEYLDDNSSAWFMFASSTRAFALWVDMICVLYIFIVTFSFLIFKDNYQSGDVGLAILHCLSIIGSTQYNIRQTVTLENQMTSVEKIMDYCKVPEEENANLEKKTVNSTWPKNGGIKFKNFSMKYSEIGSHILKNINIEIKPMEKVGIVGRTGAGKSSLIQALFRLAVNKGIVEIDNVDISELALEDLRSKISIIPQDPVLFSGTLKYNLDPFDNYKDDIYGEF